MSKEDFAKAVAACLEPGLPRRVGTERLFAEDEGYYERIFRSDKPHFYLTRWWLMKLVDGAARGDSDRQWAKYSVLFFLWREVGHEVNRHSAAFVSACERPNQNLQLHVELRRATRLAFDETLRYFRANRGKGRDRVEVSVFFKRKDVFDGFAAYWNSRGNRSRASVDRAISRFTAGLRSGVS